MMRVLKSLVISFFLLAFLSQSLSAQKGDDPIGMKIKFYPAGKTYDEILGILKESNKIGFLYFTTDGCKPCKRMQEEFFGDEEVSRYINEHFASFRIHTRRDTGPALKRKFAIFGHPTVIFLTKEGLETDRIAGYFPKDEYIKLMKNVNLGEGTLLSLKKKYEQNPEDVETAMLYAGRLMHNRDIRAKQIYEKLLTVVKDGKILAEVQKNLKQINNWGKFKERLGLTTSGKFKK